jgi:hypothetical protein
LAFAWLGVELGWPPRDSSGEPRGWVELRPGPVVVGWWAGGDGADPQGRALSGSALGTRAVADGSTRPPPTVGRPDLGRSRPGWAAAVALGLALAAAIGLRPARRDRSGAWARLDADAGALGLGLILGFGIVSVELVAHVLGAPAPVAPLAVGAAAASAWSRVGRPSR